MPLFVKQEKLRKLGADIFSEQSLLLFAFFRALKSYIKAAKPINLHIIIHLQHGRRSLPVRRPGSRAASASARDPGRHLGRHAGPRRQLVAREPESQHASEPMATERRSALTGEAQASCPTRRRGDSSIRTGTGGPGCADPLHLDPVAATVDARRAAAANPSTTAAMSSGSIHFGTSGSSPREPATVPTAPVASTPMSPGRRVAEPAMASAPWAWQAAATLPTPAQRAASGASYGQSESCTDASSITIVPRPPRARRP